MGITITFTADSADELRNLRDEFSTFVKEGAFTTISASGSVPSAGGDAPATTAKRQRKPADAATEAPPPAAESAPAADDKAVQQTIGITLKDVQEKLRALAKAGKGAEVKKMLNDDFGVANLSAIPEDRLEDISAAADLL